MSDAPVREDKLTEQAADGTWAGLRQQKKVLGINWHWWVWITVIYLNVMDGAVAELWKWGAALMNADFGWKAAQITAVRGYGSWISAGLAIPLSWVYERYFRDSKRGIMWMFLLQIVGELWWGAFALLLAPQRYWVLFAMEIPYRALTYLGGLAQYYIIVNWFETRRGLALGMTGTTGEGGTPVLWGALGAWFTTKLGYPKATFVASLFLLPAIPLVSIFIKNWPSNVGLLPWGADPQRAHLYTQDQQQLGTMTRAQRRLAAIPPAQRWGFNLREVVKVPGFWFLIATSFLSPLFWYFQAAGIGLHGRAIGMSVQTIGLAVTIYGFWYMLQGSLLGHTFDWKGWDYKYAVSWGPLGGITLASTLMTYTRSTAGYMLGYMCVAMGVAAWAPMWTALFVDTYGPLAIGVVRGFGYAFATSSGVAIGLIFLGIAFDRYGNLYPVFKINIWTGILCTVLFWVAARPTLKAYRSLKNPPPWAFAKNAEQVRKQPRKVVPVFD